MLDETTIQELKASWYTFEEVESIKRWLQDVKDGNVIPEEQFWKEIYAAVNTKMKTGEYVQN